MTIVAEHFDYVVGIDTHARTHTYAIVNTRTGARDGCQTFPVSAAGILGQLPGYSATPVEPSLQQLKAHGPMARRSPMR